METSTRHQLILAGITIACLLPFVGKPFNVDEPLFLWAAKQIQHQPTDFYGFPVNWDGVVAPMSQKMQNPPLASYYIAATAALIGWSEVALHTAFLLPAIGTVLGTYRLARRLCSRPFEATLIGMLSPVFLVSSTNIMCDTMMTCFFVWSVVFWIEGLESKPRLLLVSSILILLASLTKYFGMSLIPLLTTYSLLKEKRIGPWLAYLLLPVAGLAWFQWYTNELYGRGLLFDAASYASNFSVFGSAQLLPKLVTGVSFMGGCFIVVLFFVRDLFGRKGLSVLGILATITLIAMFIIPPGETFNIPTDMPEHVGFAIQFSFFFIAGAILAWLTASGIHRNTSPETWLLILWIVGTFLFATVINWTTNGRSILPMMPVVGILAMHAIEQRGKSTITQRGWIVRFAPGALIALLVVIADYSWAHGVRAMAEDIGKRFGQTSTTTLWYQGHWGFQYYMDQQGGHALDLRRSGVRRGDIIVIPRNNTALYRMSEEHIPQRELLYYPSNFFAATMSFPLGAGFYSDFWGALPYVFGRVPPDQCLIHEVKTSLRFQ